MRPAKATFGPSPAKNATGSRVDHARAVVNTAGPLVGAVMKDVLPTSSTEGVRLVRGTHIVTRKLYDHDRCYFFQGPDGRIIVAIPYGRDFTLIGTTDADHKAPLRNATTC